MCYDAVGHAVGTSYSAMMNDLSSSHQVALRGVPCGFPALCV